MTRYRLLDPPHKGIRNLLGQWSLVSGRTDVQDAAELAELRDLTARVVALLEDHARNEEAWVFPLAEARRPGSTAALTGEHEELDALLLRARDAIDALSARSGQHEALAAHLLVTEFQARYLLHLLEEERELEPLLWELYTDDELRAEEAEVARHLDPALLLHWFAACAPARTIAEDAEVLANVRQALPPEAFAGVLAAVQPELPPARFAAIVARLG